MGESGIGKSTLLNLVAGLDRPDAGAITLDGVELGDARRRRADRAAPRAHGLRVPGVSRAAVPDGRAERRAAAVAGRRCGPDGGAQGRGDARLRSDSPTAARACRASSPAASCSGSRSRALSSTGRASCSPTSPRATSIPRAPAQVLRLLRDQVKANHAAGHPRHPLARCRGDGRPHADAHARRTARRWGCARIVRRGKPCLMPAFDEGGRHGPAFPRVSATGAVFRGSLAQNRVRTVLAVLAIALGVALGYAVQLINQAAVNELAQGVQTLSGDGRSRSARTARRLRRERSIRRSRACPRWRSRARSSRSTRSSPARDDALRIVGIDVFRAGFIQPGLIAASGRSPRHAASRRAVPEPRGAALARRRSRATSVHVQVALADVPLRVAGELAAGGSQRFAVMDIAGAQAAFDRLGRFSRIDLRLRPGVDDDGVRRALCARPCRRDLPSCVRRQASRRARACRARIASTSTCSRWSRCSPAACSCSRRRRTRSCAGARSSRCCACSA